MIRSDPPDKVVPMTTTSTDRIATRRPPQSGSARRTSSAATAEKKRIAGVYTARLRRGDLLSALVYLSVAIVLAIFLADGGAAYFTNIRDVATGAGIVAGLIGSDLLLVMLLLSARVPIIDRTFGHDKALAQHRKLGKPVLYLILAHMVLLLVGYGIAEGLNPIAEIFSMINTMEDMLLAFIGLALMITVVISSLVVARKKLPYQVWHVIHLLSYGAVLAALPHQFSTGMLFAEGTWARWYWAAFFFGTLAAIAIYRFILPVTLSLKHAMRVESVIAEAPGVVSITMTGRRLAELPTRGGQFFNWRFWSATQWWDSHPFSLSAAPDGKRLRITVRDLGDGSHRLLSLKRGTRVSFEGPYGIFSEAARTTTKAVFIGAGIGITPIRAMLEDARLAPNDATVILRGTTDEDVYLWQETFDLCVAKHASLRVVLGKRPRGVSTWLSAEAYSNGERLTTLAPDIKNSDVFICGPTPWTDLVIRDAKRAGVPAHQIHAERFDF